MDIKIIHIDRVLQEDLNDARESWAPILLALILTVIQSVFFLSVFECGRRNKLVESVYDRRRGVYPQRVPPPLMRNSGFLRGWLGFEWWRLKVSDEEYKNQSIEEDQERRKDADSKENGKDDNGVDRFVQAAERQCWRDSPFYDPFSEGSLPSPRDHALSTESFEDEHKDDYPAAASFDAEETGELMMEDDGTVWMETPDGPVKTNLTMEDFMERTRIPEQEPLPVLATESSPRQRRRPSLIQSFNQLGKKRVSSGETDPTTVESPTRRPSGLFSSSQYDIEFGRDQAARLDRLRFGPADDGDNNSLASGTSVAYACGSVWSVVLKFVRKRILMIDDTEGLVHRQTAHHFVAHKVTRRPLTKEDQEILRCVGVDAFMTLRFLWFGFDVSFWPGLLSLVTLIPLFQTGNGVGFSSTTVIALSDGSWKFIIVMLFAFVHFLYILRRVWVKWEIFLPLRYDFLENGDFAKEKYKEQYRKTCLIEYVSSTQRHDKSLYAFFDTVFPGKVKRAEVLLNTEYMRSLFEERLHYIVAYENVFAKKVHRWAEYLRALDAYERQRYHLAQQPREPREPLFKAPLDIEHRKVISSVLFPSGIPIAKNVQPVRALQWYYDVIQKLNMAIDDEYFRLAQAQRRVIPKRKESRLDRLARWLGLKYLTASDTGRLHSSTAFVEFQTLAAKQEAIQCNITGTSDCMVVSPVPEVRDVIWENMHISRALIEKRRAWVNLILTGGLLLWSFLVSLIRNYTKLGDWFGLDYAEDPILFSIFDFYIPALVTEGIVRLIPSALRFLSQWIRFKSASEDDYYVLRWYFAYRLFTFVFVIVGEDIIGKSDELIDDPFGLLRRLSDDVVDNSVFFIFYVIVTGGIQVFFRMSQLHNLVMFWFVHNITHEEAVSQRRLDKIRTSIKVFHLDEFIPLFLFIFMIGAVYGTLAPLSALFVAGFFLVAAKVFKFMTLFVYGNRYEGGGFLFYTLSNILFYVLYMIILVLAGYLSVHGSNAVAGVFLVLLGVVFIVQRDVNRAFVQPSKTLSLAKACAFDGSQDLSTLQERARQEYFTAKRKFEGTVALEADGELEEEESLLQEEISFDDDATRLQEEISFDDDPSLESFDEELSIEDETSGVRRRPFQRRLSAAERLQRQYLEDDFFIYRQPSLNRATWEVAPRPYRESGRREEVKVWR